MSPLEVDHQLEEGKGGRYRQEVSLEECFWECSPQAKSLTTFSASSQIAIQSLTHSTTTLTAETLRLSELIKVLRPDKATRSENLAR